MQSYYETLEVAESSSQQEIKAAFIRLAKKYHPDLNNGLPYATKRMQLINEAYTILKDPIKRLEYDSWISLNRGSEPTSDDQEHIHAENTTTEVPHFHCEKCGRQDPSLRVTIFLYVMSLIFFTMKRGWSHILCSRCRIKYALLFDLEILFLGWWGFPWGIIYSIEGIFRDTFGGIQPIENNASLLALLGYDLSQQGRYYEAYKCISESYRLRPSIETKKFLDFLSGYTSNKPIQSLWDRLCSLNPAYFAIPLIIIVVFGMTRMIFSSTDSGYHQQYDSDKAGDDTSRIKLNDIKLANYDRSKGGKGLDIARFDACVDICNKTVADVASYIYTNAPVTGTTYQAGTTTKNYAFDREKFDEQVIEQYASAIYNQCKTAIILIPNDFRKKPNVNTSDEDQRMHLEKQIDFMLSAYYNIELLRLDIIFFKYFDDSVITSKTIQEVKNLSNDSLLKAWLGKNRVSNGYDKLLTALNEFNNLNDIRQKLKRLKPIITQNKSSVDELNIRLNRYKSAEDFESFNALVPEYNAAVKKGQKSVAEFNSFVEKQNKYNENMNISELQNIFNNCIDTRILLTEFDNIDLNKNGKSASKNSEY